MSFASTVGRALDAALSILAPHAAMRRSAAREGFERLRGRAYDSGRLDTSTKLWKALAEAPDATNLAEIQRTRWRAWDLYRNNPHARKIVRALTAQICGTGLRPEPAAELPDGTPNSAFRVRAAQLWRRINRELARGGRPGQGGLDLGGLQCLALREVIVAGEVLGRFVRLPPEESRGDGNTLPLELEMIGADRIADDLTLPGSRGLEAGHVLFRGIELDPRGRPVSYRVYDREPQSPIPLATAQAKVIEARDVLHLYVQERAGQLRGMSWFAPAVMTLRNLGDYEFNELLASAISACVTMAVRRNPGSASIGLAQPSGDDEVNDLDGNKITNLKPGTIFDLRAGEELVGFNPQRPNAQIEPFTQHLLRGTATAFPGLKASQLTGDYRNSSFASERSSENDNWNETAAMQAWFASEFCQPIYEQVLETAVLAGWFNAVEGFSAEDYAAEPWRYQLASWHGPVSKSINPYDDRHAAALAIKTGLSSVQREAAALNLNWREMVNEIRELLDYAARQGVPEDLILAMYGKVESPQSSEQSKETKAERRLPGSRLSSLDSPLPSNGNTR